MGSNGKRAARNFMYHIARMVSSLATNKADYDQKELQSLDIPSVNDSILKSATKILVDLVSDYIAKNPQENIINIAKSKRFVDEMNKSLRERLPTESIKES